MPPAVRLPTRTAREDDESDDARRPTQTQRGRRRAPASDDEDDEAEDDGNGDEMDIDGAESDPQDQIVKKLVRYALACEYQRVKITRAGINEKVIGKQRGTAYKRIFEAAQRDLRKKFGMEMVPLPANEKFTVKQKRAAAKTNNSKLTTTAAYILTSILPPEYKSAEIMPPSIISSQKEEAQYMAVCTTIVSLIALSPGDGLPDAKLNHYLARLNLDKNTPVGSLNDTLSRMRKEGYVTRVIDSNPDGDESTDWHVGPRGKVEIGSRCIRGFVTEMYGDRAPDDLDKKLQRSLGMDIKRAKTRSEETAEEVANADPGPSTQRGRRRRNDDSDDD